MYLNSCAVALPLGLFLYFTDYFKCIVLFPCAFLIYRAFKKIQSDEKSKFKNGERAEERSVQTDPVVEIQPIQESKEDVLHCTIETEPDSALGSKYPKVKTSLSHVFQCAYNQLILSWYTAPELTDHQPLYKALRAEFELAVDQIIKETCDFDFSWAAVDCIRVLTQHIHLAKKSKRPSMFSTKTEELVVLRVFSKALVRKLLPESLWGLQLYHCALNEIVALNALGLLVIWFSDPDNLNQMIVKFLGTGIPKSSEYKQNDESANQSENTSLNSFRDDSEEDQSSGEKKTQKKTQKKIWKRVLTQPWSSAKEKLKQLKKKKKKKLKNESFSEMCSPAMLMNSNDGSSSSREGSTGSQLNSDNDESMSEDRMEFELSYKMWQFGEWAVTVTSFQKENEQSCFVIHVEEKLGHEHLQWDVKKTEAEIISFIKEGLGKECPIKKDENMDEEKTKDILERLLQELVSDETLGKSEQVFQFLFPLNRLLQENETHGLMWDFLSNLFYMLTTTPEEENVTVETDVGQGISDESELDHMDDFQIPKDNRVCEDAKSVDQKHSATRDDPVKAQVMDLPMKNVKEPQPALKDVNKTNDGDTVTTCANDDPSPVVHSNKREPAMMSFTQSDPGSHQSVENKSKNNDKSPEKKPKRMSDPKQLKREPKNSEAITAAVDLLKEISGSVLFLKLIEHIANTLSLGKSKVTRFLDALNPTEDQMAGYIDSICESQWPNGLPCEPAPPRTPEEKQLTRRQAFDFITKKNSEWGLKLLISKSNLETVFKIFQETEENKRLVYMLLFDLLRKFLPEETALNDISKRYVIDFSKGKEKQS